MTPLPKRRHSTRRQGKRTAALTIKSKQGTKCTQCGSIILTHTVCKECGYYKGQLIIQPRNKK